MLYVPIIKSKLTLVKYNTILWEKLSLHSKTRLSFVKDHIEGEVLDISYRKQSLKIQTIIICTFLLLTVINLLVIWLGIS